MTNNFGGIGIRPLQDNILACAKKINAIGMRNFTKDEKEVLNKLLKKIIMNIEEHL